MRKFPRRWGPPELIPSNKAKRVKNARTLLQALRSDSEKHFAHTITGDEIWFYYSYESPRVVGHGRDEAILRVSQTIGSKKRRSQIFTFYAPDTKGIILDVIPANIHQPDGTVLSAARNRKYGNKRSAVELLVALLADDLPPALPVR
jgi:hypothetical protein